MSFSMLILSLNLAPFYYYGTGKECKANELASMGIFTFHTRTVNSKLKEIVIFMLAVM